MKKLLSILAFAACLLGLALPAGAIINGTPDTEHPEVGQMRGIDPGGTPRKCSGTVIGDGVFLTAGHCAVLSDVTLHFGENLDETVGENHTVYEATSVVQHPEYTTAVNLPRDVGIVLFNAEGAELPQATLASENYINTFTKDELKSSSFETIGYGLHRNDANGNSQPLESDGIRRIATHGFRNLHNEFLQLELKTGGGCFGDSGGPHLMNGKIVSVTSFGDNNCVATDQTQRVDVPVVRDWILSFLK